MLVLTVSIFLSGCAPMSQLPDYVVINKPDSLNKHVLRQPAATVALPLSPEDAEITRQLIAKYDAEKNIAGLAAPQIGYNKRIIVFAVNDDPELKKWRQDLTQTMPKTVWINASYEADSAETTTDYEGCFSVADLTGPVARYQRIRYRAYTPEGQLLEGIATGFLARVIQHEIDHTNGILFIDKVDSKDLLSMAAYRQLREAALKVGES